MKKLILILFFIQPLIAKDYTLPTTKGESINVFRIETGHNDSPEVLVYENGEWLKTHRSTHNAFILRHSSGDFMIDTGLGSYVDRQFKKMPLWAQAFFRYNQSNNIKTIQKKSPKGIILTHMHWDHTSALEEFLESKVMVDKNEYDGAFSKDRSKHAYLKEQYDSSKIKWSYVDWTEKSYGPFKKYSDLFGDGSVVLLPLYGHSKGSIGVLVRASETQRLFFVGDSVWHVSQIYTKSHKMWLSSCLTDENKEETYKTINLLHNIWKNNKDIKFIPAHHYEAMKFLPSW